MYNSLGPLTGLWPAARLYEYEALPRALPLCESWNDGLLDSSRPGVPASCGVRDCYRDFRRCKRRLQR